MPRALTLVVMIALCDVAAAQNGGVVVRTVGLPGTHINDVNVAATDPAIAYAATDAGIFKTVNRAQSWTRVRPGATGLVALAAADAKTAYASTDQSTLEIVKT